jgi:membrane-associated phospholipid phosphatase
VTSPHPLARLRATRPTAFVRRAADAVTAAVGAVVLAVSGVIASDGKVGSVERAVFRAINDLPGALYPLVWPFMQLGNIVLGPLVALVAAALGRYRLAVAALGVTVAKLVGERIVKAAVERQRPAAVIHDVTTRGDTPLRGQSFVSGHLVLVVALAVLVTPYLAGRWKAVPWVLAAIVGFGRIYVGAHNPLDVVGGAGLGALIGGLANLAVGVPRTPTEER